MDVLDPMEDADEVSDFQIWKKNAIYLYDTLLTHTLDWPSLTVQWFPKCEQMKNASMNRQKLILGTQTSGEPNSLFIAQAIFPKNNYENPKKEQEISKEQKQGYMKGDTKIRTTTKIRHDGDVNRARYMPFDSFNIIATKSSNSQIYIFDFFKHPNEPESDLPIPELTLSGHTKEGYGLSWNNIKKGCLVSGSDDGLIFYWDIDCSQPKVGISATRKYDNKHPIEDVCWHCMHSDIFASVGDDRKIKIFDTRNPNFLSIESAEIHNKDIFSIDFNPFNEWLICTGSADNLVKISDIRKLQSELYKLNYHQLKVNSVKWSPFNETVLSSAGDDCKAVMWDISLCQNSPTIQSNEDNKKNILNPEIIFIHAGHTMGIHDISWNMQNYLFLASVDGDNSVQVWKLNDEFYFNQNSII